MLRIVFVCLALGGCSTLNLAGRVATGDIHNISPSAVYKMEAAYTAAATLLAGYRSLPYCSKAPPPCQTGAIARRIQVANAQAYTSLRKLEAFSREHPKLDATALIVGATIAIGTVEDLAKEYGTK